MFYKLGTSKMKRETLIYLFKITSWYCTPPHHYIYTHDHAQRVCIKEITGGTWKRIGNTCRICKVTQECSSFTIQTKKHQLYCHIITKGLSLLKKLVMAVKRWRRNRMVYERWFKQRKKKNLTSAMRSQSIPIKN